MKISSVSNEFNQMRSLNAKQNQSFGSGMYNIIGGYKAKKVLEKEIIKNSSGFSRFLMNLGKNNGEVLNTWVTAIGTACVAPIFIVHNPFSHEDKETRKYSAWRQPISAVLAVAAQIFTYKKYSTWLNKMFSTGQFKNYQDADLTAAPTHVYLKPLSEMEKPHLTRIDRDVDLDARRQSAFDKVLAEKRQKLKNTDIKYIDLLDSRAKADFADYHKALNTQAVKSQVKTEFATQLADITDAAQRDIFIEKQTSEKLNKLLNTKIDNRWEKIKGNFTSQIDEIKNGKTFWIFPKSDKKINKELADFKKAKGLESLQLDFLEEQLRIKARAKFRLLKIKQIAERKGINIDDMISLYEKHLTTVKQQGRPTKLVEELQYVIDKMKIFKADGNGFKSLKKHGDNFTQVLQDVKIKKLVTATINNSEKVLKDTLKWGGIVVTMLTLPISCGLLNWAYPRIMEYIMPEVAAKKAQGQNKKEVKA